jgi:predicted dehydrogenase
MTRTTVGIVLNGVTGRMGLRQHLVRSLLAIREQGGLPLRDGSTLWPEPVLVGRSEAKLRDIADRHGLTEWTTDLAAALARPDVPIYFDSQVTSARTKALRMAIEAGKHVYTEKPIAEDLATAVELAELADAAGGQARRGAGQAVPARLAQAGPVGAQRFLRADPFGTR